jgi:general secretion pathway protein G
MDIRRKNIRSKSAMTLIEILVVITLLGLLAGVLIKSIAGNLEAGKLATAQLFCKTSVKGMVAGYQATHNGKLPKDMNALENAGFMKDDNKKDPWGEDYKLAAVEKDGNVKYVVVWSGGPAKATECPVTLAGDKALNEGDNKTAIENAENDSKVFGIFSV